MDLKQELNICHWDAPFEFATCWYLLRNRKVKSQIEWFHSQPYLTIWRSPDMIKFADRWPLWNHFNENMLFSNPWGFLDVFAFKPRCFPKLCWCSPRFCWLILSTQLRSLASYHCFLVKVPTNAAYIAILPLNILNTKYHILMMLKMVKHG